MAYGFRVTNANGEVVIDDQHAVLTSSGEGSSVQNRTRSGVYQHYALLNALPNDAIYAFKLDVGQRIAMSEYPQASGDMPQVCANFTPVTYHTLIPRNELSNPVGYGMAVYNAAGQVMWDAESSICKVASAGTVPRSYFQNTSYSAQNTGLVIPSTANAIYMTGGLFQVDIGVQQIVAVSFAERTSLTEWRIRFLGTGNSGGGGQGSIMYYNELNYLFAEVT